MGQFISFGGRGSALLGAGALIVAAAPALAGGHAMGHAVGHVGGVHVVRPGVVAGPVRPVGPVRPGFVAGVRPGGPGWGYRPGAYGPRPGGFYGSYGRYGYDYGYAYPRPYYGARWGGGWGPGYGGGWPGGDVSVAMQVPVEAPVYPFGYGEGSYAPTGYGVSYNVPPPVYAPAKIIYISGNHVRRETYLRPKQRIIVRGSASVD
jgi:hypothetical protein